MLYKEIRKNIKQLDKKCFSDECWVEYKVQKEKDTMLQSPVIIKFCFSSAMIPVPQKKIVLLQYVMDSLGVVSNISIYTPNNTFASELINNKGRYISRSFSSNPYSIIRFENQSNALLYKLINDALENQNEPDHAILEVKNHFLNDHPAYLSRHQSCLVASNFFQQLRVQEYSNTQTQNFEKIVVEYCLNPLLSI